MNTSLSRRRFLQTTAATAVITGCSTSPIKPEEIDEIFGKDVLTFQLYRPEDRFSAKLEIYGLELKTFNKRTHLCARAGSTETTRRFVFTLPPQHNSETTLERTSLPGAIKRIEKRNLLSSKPSVLVFNIPDDALPEDGLGMGFTLENLLAWDRFTYVTEQDINDPYAGDVELANRRYLLGLEVWKGKGNTRVSAIDLPSGFYLQPDDLDSFTWYSNSIPSKRGKNTEIWSAFVVGRDVPNVAFELIDIWGVSGGITPLAESIRKRVAQASTGPIYPYVNTTKDFIYTGSEIVPDNSSQLLYDKTSIDFYDRMELAVTLSPRFGANREAPVFKYADSRDECIDADFFEQCYSEEDHRVIASTYGVSAEGGYLALKGNWSVLPGCTIKGWVQNTSRGRDWYTRVVRKYYAYPFCFELELVEETERTYVREESTGSLVAVNVKQQYVKSVKPSIVQQFSAEECFSSIEIITERTPPLNPKDVPDGKEYKQLDTFIPIINGEPFQFEIVGVDVNGQRHSFSMPLMLVSNKLTQRSAPDEEYKGEAGRYPEDVQQSIPINSLGEDELHYVIARTAGDVCSTGKVNAILLLDSIWKRLPYRFAELNGAQVPLAPEVERGDTNVEVKWFEWVRGVRPPDLTKEEWDAGRKSVVCPLVPRIRTCRLTLPSMRRFSGTVPDMLGSYRDMRIQFVGGKEQDVNWSIDPTNSQPVECFEVGMLNPDSGGNETGAFFCILPVSSDTSILGNTYYPELIGEQFQKAESLFSGMGTLVPFGRAKSTESIGGIASPDTNVALLSRALGPVGDNRQTIERYQQFGMSGPVSPECEVSRVAASDSLALVAASDYSGLINIGVEQLFGEEAEILPGIRFSDCLKFIVSYGEGAQSFVDPRAAVAFSDSPEPPPKRKTGLQWDVKIVGADWLFNLISLGASDPGAQLILDALTSDAPAGTEIPEPIELGIEATLDWSTSDFKEIANSVFRFLPDEDTRFEIGARTWMDFVDLKPEISAYCILEEFSIEFLKSLEVEFNHVLFELEQSGRKRFDPSIANVKFSNKLEFVNALQDLLQNLGDEYGLKIDISPARVSISQSIAFPAGGDGVLYLGPATIGNLAFVWGVSIPILARERMLVEFGLSSRESPMTIAVGVYGGRAYALMKVDTEGVRLVEISSDYGGVFQAAWSGIAKGVVSLTAGFAFSVKGTDSGQEIDFLAYVNFSGSVSIVRLIFITVNIFVGLGFRSGSNGREIYGVARCSCSFRIAGIKFKYQYQVEKSERAQNSRSKASFSAQASLVEAHAPTNSCEDISNRIGPVDGYFYPFHDEKHYGSLETWKEFVDVTAY